MKVKNFRFRVSNWTSRPCLGDETNPLFYEGAKEVYDCEQIDEILDDFLKDANRIIDIRVTPIEVNKHNNGKGNTVDLIYTFLYE